MGFKLTPEQKESLLREALAEAERGMTVGEVPIGCVLALYNGGKPKVVARGFNRTNLYQRKTAHAEIIAFENAGSKEGETPALPVDAEDVILVSSLEPCVMCLGAAMEAGVAKVLFGLRAPADNGTQRVKPPESPESKMPDIEGEILANESRALFEKWLENPSNPAQVPFVRQLLELTD